MIFQKFEDIDLSNFPVIIFGSGPAGITAALKLENKKISSIIIEAGKEEYNQGSQDFYKGKIIGDHLAELSSSRLRQLGGTSGHWGGWCKPMESYNLGNWPIKKEDLDKLSLMALEDPSTSGNPKKLQLKDMKIMYEHSLNGKLFQL